MGGCIMRGLELTRYAERFIEGRIDLTDKQARKLVSDMVHEINLLKGEVKASDNALDAVIRSEKYDVPDFVQRRRRKG